MTTAVTTSPLAPDSESMSSTQTSRALCRTATDTFYHTDTIISVTLTVYLSTCTHYTSNGPKVLSMMKVQTSDIDGELGILG